MVWLNPLYRALCVFILPFLAPVSPAPTLVSHKTAIKHTSFSPALSYNSFQKFGYGGGGAYAAGFPYGGLGPGGFLGANFGPYGLLGAGQMYGMPVGYGYAGGYPAVNGYGAKAGGYMNQPYGVYPTMGKEYLALGSQLAAQLGPGAYYGKYAGGAYMKQPGLMLGGYGQLGYPAAGGYLAPYGGKQVAAGYGGGLGYAGAPALQTAKLSGYGSVNMLGKGLTAYG